MIACVITMIVFILFINFLMGLSGICPLTYIYRSTLMKENKGNALYIKQLWSEHPELNNMFWEYTGYGHDAWHSINYLVVYKKSNIYISGISSLIRSV